MSALEIYLCGQSKGFDVSDGNTFADQWAAAYNSIPPRPVFTSIQQACTWLSAMYTGPNPCQTK